MPSIVIETQDLTVTLPSRAGDVNILRGIDLSVTRGETVGLIGPSGSGKTTLLMVLAGLEPPTSGAVAVAAHDYGAMSEDDLARFRRTHIGIVFQSFHLVPTMTALENTALPLELAGEKDCRARAAAILAEVGLADRHDHYPTQMSGGEQQRLALARAWALRPRILFLDEPTAHLDPAATASVEAIIRDIDGEGVRILMVSHDLGQVRRMAGDVLFLHNGHLIMHTDTDSFLDVPESELASAFVAGRLLW